MTEIWRDTLTFESVGAAYGDAQATTKNPPRGDLSRISARREGEGDGTVTLQVFADSSFEELILEAEFDLDGDGDVAVVGGDQYVPTFIAREGLSARCLDSADNADDIVFYFSGSVGAGA